MKAVGHVGIRLMYGFSSSHAGVGASGFTVPQTSYADGFGDDSKANYEGSFTSSRMKGLQRTTVVSASKDMVTVALVKGSPKRTINESQAF